MRTLPTDNGTQRSTDLGPSAVLLVKKNLSAVLLVKKTSQCCVTGQKTNGLASAAYMYNV
jgi:hypothetical protein